MPWPKFTRTVKSVSSKFYLKKSTSSVDIKEQINLETRRRKKEPSSLFHMKRPGAAAQEGKGLSVQTSQHVHGRDGPTTIRRPPKGLPGTEQGGAQWLGLGRQQTQHEPPGTAGQHLKSGQGVSYM